MNMGVAGDFISKGKKFVLLGRRESETYYIMEHIYHKVVG